MEDENKFRRKHLRAPLFGNLLYNLGSHVLKGSVENISEGGLCIGSLAKIPDSSFISVMFALPLYPDLSHVDRRFLSLQDIEQFEAKVIKAKIKIVRSFEGESKLEGIFLKEIGCEFVDLSFEYQSMITEYVFTFSKNMTFLLSLFEHLDSEESETCLRWCAGFLGYNSTIEIPRLRMKILHDYHSIKSL